MAKSTGLGWTILTVQDASAVAQDIRNDITSLDFMTPRAVQDVTGIDKSAHERLLLLADFSATLNGVFNNGAANSHEVFYTIPSTSVVRTMSISVNGSTMSANVLLTDYPIARAAQGELTWKVPAALADGTVPTWGGTI